MLVKCRCCPNKKIDRDTAFKVEVISKSGKKTNFYYCNEEEYNKQKHSNEMKNKVFMLVNNIFGYKILNTAIYKEMQPLIDRHGYDKVFNYMLDNKSSLEGFMNKDFKSEFGKIRYFTTILRNNLDDYVEPEPVVIREVEEVVEFKHKYKQKKKRRSLADVEGEI